MRRPARNEASTELCLMICTRVSGVSAQRHRIGLNGRRSTTGTTSLLHAVRIRTAALASINVLADLIGELRIGVGLGLDLLGDLCRALMALVEVVGLPQRETRKGRRDELEGSRAQEKRHHWACPDGIQVPLA